MYHEMHAEDIGRRSHAPEIAEILDIYDSCADADSLVDHDYLSNLVMPRYGKDVMVIDPTGDGDFIYSYFGPGLTRQVGEDRSGQRSSVMSPRVAEFTIAAYARALSDRTPLYTVHRSLRAQGICLWERLILPTRTKADNYRLVVYGRLLRFQEDLLNVIIETSTAAIIALRAIRDGSGSLQNAHVVVANRRAANLAGRPDESLIDQDVRSLFPFLQEEDNWNRCLRALQRNAGDIIRVSYLRDGRETWLQVAIAPLGGWLVLTMTDVSELMLANRTLRDHAETLTLEIGRERATRAVMYAELDERVQREEELRRLADTDALTALLNRRSFIERSERAISDCVARGEDASLIIVDIDHFKSVNDSHGHSAGDTVIRAFADILIHMVPLTTGLVGRFGGEEFAIFMPNAGSEAAGALALAIKNQLAAREIPVSETQSLSVSASFGVATRLRDESFAAFMARTDRALYRAKHDGRDCIRLANEGMSCAA
jgi:diguanylate cyclase (GGDEF)-like protein